MKIDGQLLKKQREAKGYSQRELAEITAVSVATLNKWEVLPTANPFPSKLSKVANALDINIEDLICEEYDDKNFVNLSYNEIDMRNTQIFNILSELLLLNRNIDQKIISDIQNILVKWKTNNNNVK